MSFLPYPPASTSAAIEVFKQDVGLTHEVVHGSNTATVLTEGGEIPTISKLLKDLNDRIGAGTGADITLRPDLAAVNSTILVGGVEAGNLAKRYSDNIVVVADKTATTSAVPAINAAIETAVAKGGNDRANIKGTTITLPDGRYLLDSPLSALSVSGITLQGSSKTACTLVVTHAGVMATLGDPTKTRSPVGIVVRNFRIEYISPNGLAKVFEVSNGFGITVEDIILENVPTFISAGAASDKIAGGVTVSNIQGSIANIGTPMFNLKYGAGLYLSNVSAFVRGVQPPTHPASMTTVAGTGVFKCETGFWDTVQCDNAIFERFDVGLSCVSATGVVYQNFYFTNTIMDYFKRSCIYLETNGGVVAGMCFDDTTWLVSWEADAVSVINTAGFNDSHKIKSNVIIAGVRGVYYQNTLGKMNDFSGMHITSVNRLGTAQGAMVFATGSTGFIANNCTGNHNTTSVGLPWRADYGMVVAENCDDYSVSNCKMKGAIGGYSFGQNDSGSINRRATNNVSANYAGKKLQTLPASDAVYVNTTPHVEEWSFFGGVLTNGYQKNGEGLAGPLTYVTFRLQPNDSFAVGYSTAPTIQVFVEP